MKQLDHDSYEFEQENEYYGLVTRQEGGWVAWMGFGPATITVKTPCASPEEARDKALAKLQKLYQRVAGVK